MKTYFHSTLTQARSGTSSFEKNSNPYCGELAFRISNSLFSAFSFGEGGAVQPNLLCVRVLSSQRSRVAVLDTKVSCRRSSTTSNSCSAWLFRSKSRQLNLDKNLSEIAIDFVDYEAAEFKELNS